MVLETPEIAHEREMSKRAARAICKLEHPERLAELEKFIALTEAEGNQHGGTVSGLPYRLHRNGFGNWCGYVAVFHDHPAYGKDEELDLDVHGGITFSNTVHAWGHGDMWWIGFDTSHAHDAGYMAYSFPLDIPGITYKNKQYAIKECQKLAEQLNTMQKSSLYQNSTNSSRGKKSKTRGN